jgi:hypothetical protein
MCIIHTDTTTSVCRVNDSQGRVSRSRALKGDGRTSTAWLGRSSDDAESDKCNNLEHFEGRQSLVRIDKELIEINSTILTNWTGTWNSLAFIMPSFNTTFESITDIIVFPFQIAPLEISTLNKISS